MVHDYQYPESYWIGELYAHPHVPVGMDAPLTAFEEISAGYPVFRLVSNKNNKQGL